jgi:hypothetical protein
MPAKSKSQQRLMGMVSAYQDGKLKLSDLPKDVSQKVRSMAKGMSKKDVDKFAETRHKGLPEEAKETFKEYLLREK